MMKRTILILCLVLFAIVGFQPEAGARPAVWVKCGADTVCAQNVSGISFPLDVKNYKLRARKNIIEMKFPFDKYRDIYVRKSRKAYNGGDISGVVDNYPVVKQIKLKNGAKVDIRGYSNKFFIVLFSISDNYYSVYCKNGLKKKEVNEIYEKIKSAN